MIEDIFYYTPLPEPIPITEQSWPQGTMPLVHTRTMTFNHELYIRECIDGILMQKTTFPVQVLIHDDASTDKTTEIVREYEQRYPSLIKAYYQKENSYSQKDKFDRRADFFKWRTGKYEAVCEGDDYWIDCFKLQRQVTFLEDNPDYNLCFHSSKALNQSNQRILFNYRRHLGNKTFSSRQIIVGGGSFIPTASILIRTNVVRKRQEWFEKSPVGDLIFAIIGAVTGKVYYIDNLMSVYRIHNSSWTFNINGDDKKHERFNLHMRIIEILESIKLELNEEHRKSIDKLIKTEIKVILSDKSNDIHFSHDDLHLKLGIIDKVDVYFIRTFPIFSKLYRKAFNFIKFIF